MVQQQKTDKESCKKSQDSLIAEDPFSLYTECEVLHMVSILAEPAFRESIWCRELRNSLENALRNKRIPFCEIFDTVPKDSEGVFVLATGFQWIKQTIKSLNEAGIHPILMGNQLEQVPGCSYSCVCSDVLGSMKYLLEKIKSENKREIAFYGVNTNSISDIGRVDSLFALKDDFFGSMAIFENNGDLGKCYEDFRKRGQHVDAVICANEFAAVSLLRNLQKDNLPVPKILSCSQSQLLRYYSRDIVTIDLNYEQYGKAAVFIYEKRKKYTYMSNLSISVRWGMEETPGMTAESSIPLPLWEQEDRFYEDRELDEMLKVEAVLEGSDDTDKKILQMLLEGNSVGIICESCFLAETAVKYRLRKLLKHAKIENKEELLTLLRKYLP